MTKNVNVVVENATVENVKNTPIIDVYGCEFDTNSVLMEAEADGFNYTDFSKALRKLFTEACTLKQALQTLDGLMCLPIEYQGEEMSVRTLFNRAGFNVGAKNFSVKAFVGGCKFKSEVGRIQMYRNVGAYIPVEDPTQNTSDNKKHNNRRLYYHTKDGWKPCTKMVLVDVDDNKWNVATVLRVITQSACPNEMAKRAQKSADKWEKIKDVAWFSHSHNKNEDKNVAHYVKKELAQF